MRRTRQVHSGRGWSHVLQLEPLETRTVPSFAASRAYDVGSDPVSIAVRDFNQDGLADLAVANSSSGSVSVLLGNGDGSFQDPRALAVGRDPRGVAAEDFNGDGVADLAVAHQATL